MGKEEAGPDEERSRLNGTILWGLKDDMSAQGLGNASHGFILHELYFTLSIHNPPATIYTECWVQALAADESAALSLRSQINRQLHNCWNESGNKSGIYLPILLAWPA